MFPDTILLWNVSVFFRISAKFFWNLCAFFTSWWNWKSVLLLMRLPNVMTSGTFVCIIAFTKSCCIFKRLFGFAFFFFSIVAPFFIFLNRTASWQCSNCTCGIVAILQLMFSFRTYPCDIVAIIKLLFITGNFPNNVLLRRCPCGIVAILRLLFSGRGNPRGIVAILKLLFITCRCQLFLKTTVLFPQMPLRHRGKS